MDEILQSQKRGQKKPSTRTPHQVPDSSGVEFPGHIEGMVTPSLTS